MEDHWDTDANRLDQDDEAKQETMSREVLKIIWIKERNDWGVEDIMEEREGSRKQVERYCETPEKKGLLGYVIRADNSDPMS